jgi:hypothetical protein
LQAHKRGLDVEKLNGSRTPAWRSLRGRDGAAKKQSYFEGPEDEEDELADQPSDGEAAAGKKGKRSRAAAAADEEDEDDSSEVRTCCIAFLRCSSNAAMHLGQQMMPLAHQSCAFPIIGCQPDRLTRRCWVLQTSEDELDEEDEEEEEEEGEGQLEEEEAPRYSRRVRNTVQHYSPPNDPAPAAARGSGGGGSGRRRRSYQQDPDEEEDSEEVHLLMCLHVPACLPALHSRLERAGPKRML